MSADQLEAGNNETDEQLDLGAVNLATDINRSNSADVAIEQTEQTTDQSPQKLPVSHPVTGDRDLKVFTVLPRNLQDNEVEVLSDNLGSPASVSLPSTHDWDMSDAIDLTMDDDDNGDYQSQQSHLLSHQECQVIPVVKEEPRDSTLPMTPKKHACLDLYQPANLHRLPSLNMSPLPDEGPVEACTNNTVENTEISSTTMAELLNTYNKNIDHLSVNDTVYDSDKEDEQARALFEKQQSEYEARIKSKSSGLHDEVDFRRVQEAEIARQRSRRNRKQHEYEEAQRDVEQNSIFIPESIECAETPLGFPSGDEIDEDPSSAEAPGTTSSKTGGTSKSTKEAQRQVKVRSKGRKNGTAGRNTSGKSGVSKVRQPKTGSKRGRKGESPAIINTATLLRHDIIGDANANEGQARQPVFTSTRKSDALAELIASIPAENRNLHAGDKIMIDKATKSFNGQRAIKSDGNGNWKLRGMRTSLKNYQLLGVSWMRDRENQQRHPRGGILSDDMGLGKTVSTLANMVDGVRSSKQTGAPATLVIVPPTIMSQWLNEIEKHLESPGKVVVYRSKMKVINPAEYLASHDMVITSYHEVLRSIPTNNPPPHLSTKQAKDEWWAKELEANKGPLHRVFWHRIVLDEAQAIKNHVSKTSEAVCLLRGRFRWCLSGTPIQNCLEEFYPYFKFLRVEATGSFDIFKRNFAKAGSEKALQRLQVYLGKIMLRRTHASKLFGCPILTLPPIKPMHTIEVVFNAVERNLYRIINRRFMEKVKSLSQKDKLENNYKHIFTLFLRLRQVVGHPLLIQKTLKELLELEDLELLWSLSGATTDADNNDNDGCAATALGIRNAIEQGPNPELAGLKDPKKRVVQDNDLSRAFRGYLQALKDDGRWAEANSRALCASCGDPPEKAFVTSCHHLYCFGCYDAYVRDEKLSGRSGTECGACGSTIQMKDSFATTPCARSTSDSPEAEEDIDWYKVPGRMLRSAKIKGAVGKIREWFKQDPKNKIIVFSHFKGMINVMARICQEENWMYAQYHGAMSYDFRDMEVQRLNTDENCKILLAATKAGGVGLNLTVANRVLILDPWWNSSVETQAYARVFRIGQQRDVEVARIVVHDSIETQILKMQVRKAAEIEQAMDEHRRPTLTTKELIELFQDSVTGDENEAKDSEEGTTHDRPIYTGADEPFIFPDDPYARMEMEQEDREAMMEN